MNSIRREWVWSLTGCFVLVAVLLMVVAMPPTREVKEAPVPDLLPDRVGDWVGRRILHCQNEACMKQYLASQVSQADGCPVCGAELASESLGVRLGLPADTRIQTMNYAAPVFRTSISVTLVVSGRQQKSIHRPEQCLPGQGYAVQESIRLNLDLHDGRALDVRWLEARSSEATRPAILFAYWFRGGEHETSSHWRRLYLMSRDLLVENVMHPWLYVSVQMQGSLRGEEPAVLESFIRELYPLLSGSAQ